MAMCLFRSLSLSFYVIFQMDIKLVRGIELHGLALKNALLACDGNDRLATWRSWDNGAPLCAVCLHVAVHIT